MFKFIFVGVLVLLSGCAIRARPEFIPVRCGSEDFSVDERSNAESALKGILDQFHSEKVERALGNSFNPGMEEHWVLLRWQFVLLRFDLPGRDLEPLHRCLQEIAAKRRHGSSSKSGALEEAFEQAQMEVVRVLSRNERRIDDSELARFASQLGSSMPKATMSRLATLAIENDYFRVLICGPDRPID